MNAASAERTVRKLLRVAKRGQGPEAETAAARAREIMARHHLSVPRDAEEEETREVAGVKGIFWREQLLLSVATLHRCRVSGFTGKKKRAYLQGERSDLDATLADYRRVAQEISLGLGLHLHRHGVMALRSEWPSLFRAAAAVYLRLFLNSTIQAIQERKDPSGAPPPGMATAPEPSATPAALDVAAEEALGQDLDHEVDLLFEDLNRLALIVGMKNALKLKALAEADGMAFGGSVQLRRRVALSLPAFSPAPSQENEA